MIYYTDEKEKELLISKGITGISFFPQKDVEWLLHTLSGKSESVMAKIKALKEAFYVGRSSR